MIRSVLVANRGEIARRVFRTCRRMGIATVAVHSDADATAPHVREADRAVRLGPPPARESYLLGDKVIAAALQTGAEAIHPGYGFLSENAEFAEAVAAAGLVWIGPPPSAIRAMGLKDAAKRLMIAAGVPTTPGYLGDDQNPERLQVEADRLGYPLLIKAVAGGGGKGMRKVEASGEFAAALGAARREAAASFGDDRVLLETYVARPRHIEVQVFGDTHGSIVHLFERDCSLQRRHQKVIEEAPAPGMDAATREAVCGAAVRAAQAVNYVGAGTVEFIADASEGLRADRVFFMEMNTRLQVEHPVTEMITGQDLVEWQIRVASGEPLPLRQEELKIDGWAMEARLYAENPATGFLPSTGRLTHFRLPQPNASPSKMGRWRDAEGGVTEGSLGRKAERNAASAEGGNAALSRDPSGPSGHLPISDGEASTLRIDSAVEQGGEVTPFYDPMIAKLIAHADTREAAAAALADACKSVEVWPVHTNAGFLARCLDESAFVAGDVDTGFIERRDGLVCRPSASRRALAAAAATVLEGQVRWEQSDSYSPWRGPYRSGAAGFRINSDPRISVRLEHDGCDQEISLGTRSSANHGPYLWSFDNEADDVESTSYAYATFRDGSEVGLHSSSDGVIVFADGEAYAFSEPDYEAHHEETAASGAIASPMPGKIVAVHVAEGARVAKGAPLVTLEAMKMEHVLTAPFDGAIAEVSAEPGRQVAEGVTLVRLEAAS